MVDFKKVNLNKQFEGYTPLHKSPRIDENIHATWRGQSHTVHVYGKDFPWPVGKSPDRWMLNRKNK